MVNGPGGNRPYYARQLKDFFIGTAASIGALSGPVGAAVGAALGLGSGILGGAVIANRREIQLEQAGAKLYKCERELNACGNVVERCKMALKKSQEELEQLKQVISNLGFSERGEIRKGRSGERKEGSREEAAKLFSEAMEKGYVESRAIVLLLIGAAGAGKTHFKHLILRLPPPAVRESTPLAEAAIRAISIDICQATISEVVQLTQVIMVGGGWLRFRDEGISQLSFCKSFPTTMLLVCSHPVICWSY